MDVEDEDLIRFWRILNSRGVQYIMIGGLATRFHGFNRSTDDLDLWINETPENRANLRKAFKELNYGDFPEIERMQFVPGWTSFHAAGLQLDILTEMKGLENLSFQDSLALASISDLGGVKVPFLHINHLIANKKAVNRPKDQLDVIQLEKIKKIREDHPGTSD